MDEYNNDNNLDHIEDKAKFSYDKYEKMYKRSRIINFTMVLLIISMVLGGAFAYDLVNSKSVLDSNKEANATSMPPINEGYESPVVNVAENVLPSIVMIKSKANVTNGLLSGTVDKGTGSGIIYSSDGYILTNQHVIDSATDISVTLYDGREFNARVLGEDSKSDLAVIKIDVSNLPAADFGDSDKLKVGELAVAIGNPMGEEFSGSVTSGIISAINRSINIGEKKLKLIQTDAAINPGNSGGALVNKDGKVIGINSAKLSAPEIEGMGFAIPVNDALPIIEELINHGYVKRPWIGVGIGTVTEQMANQYSIPKGIYIAKVYYGSPAEKAGLKVDDIITEINGKETTSVEDLSKIIDSLSSDEKITLKVYRKNQYNTVELTLGVMPPNS